MTTEITDRIREIAEKAITRRLRAWDPGAIRDVHVEVDTVVVTTSSGGNALAAASGLRAAGYAAEPGRDCTVRVTTGGAR